MVSYDFWETWKNRTDAEERAIAAVEKARDLVIGSVPSDALVAIYVKGSFARRELKEGSDVDMVPIVTEDKCQGAIFGVNSPAIDPVCVVPLSLSEFRKNELSTKADYTPDLRAEPDLFLLRLGDYKLIYGAPLNPEEFPVRSKEQIVRDEIRKIREGYIQAYREGFIGFQPLLKEVFWLVEWEQTLRGKEVAHSFEGITASVEDESHIVYDAFEFRKNSGFGKAEEEKFISKLEAYLNELEKTV